MGSPSDKKDDRDDRGMWADIVGPAREFERAVSKTRTREPEDLPSVKAGAKEIALLTIFKEEQKFAFEPVIAALKFLETMPDWSGSYLVADRVTSQYFKWKDAPLRKYESFQDFYKKELEEPWGKWEELQAEYADIASGKTNQKKAEKAREARAKKAFKENESRPSQQGKRLDLTAARAARAQAIDADGQGNFVYTTKNDVNEVGRPDGNEAAYAIRRLRKDRPDILARVMVGEITPNAGMVEAGFRKPAKPRRKSPLDHIRKWIPKLTPAERVEARRLLDDENDR